MTQKAPGSSSDTGGAVPPPLAHDGHGWRRVLAGVAGTAQALVMALTFLSGMMWVGWPWPAALAATVVGLVVLVVLGTRSGRTAALVAMVAMPLVSVAAVVTLAYVNERRVVDAACTDRQLRASQGLRGPTGEALAFEGTYDGCVARVESGAPTEDLTAAFVETLRSNGWVIIDPQGGRVAERNGVTLFVEPLTEQSTGMRVAVDDQNH